MTLTMEEQIRISFFKHQVNALDDEKLFKLFRKEGMAGYGVWWRLLEMLGGVKEHRLQRDYEDIAFKMYHPDLAELIKRVVEDYGLFKTNKDYFWNSSFMAQMEDLNARYQKRAAAGSKGGKRKAELKQSQSNAVAMLPENDSNATIDKIREEESRIDSEDIFPSNEAKNLPSSSSVEVVQPSTSKSKEEEDEEKLLEEKINKGEIQLFKKIEDVPVDIRKSHEEFWQLFKPDPSQSAKYKVSLMQWKDMDPKFREAVLRWLRDGHVPENRNPYYFLQHVHPQFLNKREQLQFHKAGKLLCRVRYEGKQWVCTAYVADLFQLDILDPEYNKKFE